MVQTTEQLKVIAEQFAETSCGVFPETPQLRINVMRWHSKFGIFCSIVREKGPIIHPLKGPENEILYLKSIYLST